MCSVAVQTVDGKNVRGPARRPHRGRERYRRTVRDGEDGGFTWPRRTEVDIDNMARDAFQRIDDIINDAMNGGENSAMDGNNVEGDEQCNEANMQNLVRESTERVFEGSTQNRLQCSIVLFTLCSLYSVPHTFLDALLSWIAGDLRTRSLKFH